jgi:hypothetical protein
MEPITFRCSACNQVLKVSAEKAGRKVKCNKCSAAITVPAAGTPAPEPAPAPAKTQADDDEGGTYTLKDAMDNPPAVETKKPSEDEDEDEDFDEDEDEDPAKLDQLLPKMEGPGRQAAPKQRTLLEPERWLKVRLGIFLVSCGIWTMLFALVLRQVPLILGLFNPPEYASLAMRYHDPKQASAILGGGGPEDVELSRAEFLIGLTTGSDSLQAGLWMARVAQIFVLIQGLVMLTGYVFCMAVPPRFGTRGLAISLIALGGTNLVFGVVFRLLPYCGVMDYAIIPVAVPEVVLVGANAERTIPLIVVNTSLPFLDFALAPFIVGAYFAEPILFCVFLRAVALSMKDDVFEEQTFGLVRLGLGTAFIYLCYLMCTLTGTSDVLLWLLRVLYILATCFFMGQLIWFAIVFLRVPALIDKQIDLAEIGKNKPAEDEEEGEVEDEYVAEADKQKKKRPRDEDEDEED